MTWRGPEESVVGADGTRVRTASTSTILLEDTELAAAAFGARGKFDAGNPPSHWPADEGGFGPDQRSVLPKESDKRNGGGPPPKASAAPDEDSGAGRLRMFGVLYEQLQALGDVLVANADGTEGYEVACYVGYVESDDDTGRFVIDAESTTPQWGRDFSVGYGTTDSEGLIAAAYVDDTVEPTEDHHFLDPDPVLYAGKWRVYTREQYGSQDSHVDEHDLYTRPA